MFNRRRLMFGDVPLAAFEFYGITDDRVFTKSVDGETWTVQATGASGSTGTAIIYANGLYCFVHYAGWAWSADGITWTLKPLGTTTTNQYRGVAYGAGFWVFVGTNSGTSKVFRRAESTPDGLLTNIVVGSSNRVRDIIYENGMFVALASFGFDEIYRSDDAITWSVVYTAVGSFVFGRVIWDGSRFVAVGTTGEVLTSADGITWVYTKPTTLAFLDISYRAGLYYLVVNSDGVYTSPDLITFTSAVVRSGLQTITTTPAGSSLKTTAAGVLGSQVFSPPTPWTILSIPDGLDRAMIRSRLT
jgi:hypothetical protein